jgi:hypothetical protein
VNNLTLAELIQTFPHTGELVWISLRPARGEPMIIVNEVMADQHSGLIGDRYKGASSKRQVTLIHIDDNLTVLPDEDKHC